MKMRKILTTVSLILVTLVGVSACGTTGDKVSSGPEPEVNAAGPVPLAPKKAASHSTMMSVNSDEVAKAVERLRITKKKGPGPYEHAGADLNGDGQPEAVVLLTGQDWCSPQGCTLAIFQTSDVGFKPVSQVIGVRPPAATGAGTNAGWRDLIVKTGSGKPVRLQFTGGGYPTNASTQPDASSDLAQAEVLIAAPGTSVATAQTPQTSPNAQ